MGSEKHEKKERKHEKKDKKKKKDKDSKHKKKKSDKKDIKKKEKDSKHKKQNKSSSSSSSDDDHPKVDIGPAMPPGIVLGGNETAAPDIGPALPPGIVLPSSNYVEEEDSGDEAGPSAQPAAPEADDGEADAAKVAGSGAQEEAGDGDTKKRVGPALPAGVDLEKIAAQAAKVDWMRVAEAEEDEEDDLVGPAMPGQITRGYVAATVAAEQRLHANAIAEHERQLRGDAPAHEEWMTALPDVKDLGFTLEEAQKTRTFQRKEHIERGDTSAWTDSPAEKAAKAREKAMGIKRKLDAGPAPIDTTAAAIAVVKQYNEAVRPKSLVDMHRDELAKRHKAGGGTAGSVAPGAWDKAEMQQVRPKDKKSADKMFQDAQTLAGRFGGGSFHGI